MNSNAYIRITPKGLAELHKRLGGRKPLAMLPTDETPALFPAQLPTGGSA